jgi:DNA-binding NtrC family response regulator
VLEDRGHTVVEAETAEAALALAGKIRQPFDVLVSDILMPGMNGDALARRLTDLWPELKVLLISGYVEQASALDRDRVKFLAKPFALDELTDCVAELLGPAPRARKKAAAPKADADGKAKATAVRAGSGSRRRAPSGSASGAAGRPRSGGGGGGRAR